MKTKSVFINTNERISRKDLFDQGNDISSEDESQQIKPAFDFDEVSYEDRVATDSEDEGGKKEEEDEEPAYEFNLFGNAQAVSLVEKVEKSHQERPSEYYFAKTNKEIQRAYQSVAVSGEDVLQGSQITYYGMRKPWRVVDYTELAKRTEIEKKREKRKRPGKKARLARKAAGEKRKELRGRGSHLKKRPRGRDSKQSRR